MAHFFGSGSTVPRLQSHYERTVYFLTPSRDPGGHFINIRRMKGSVDLGATKWFSNQDAWTVNSAN